MRKVYVGVGIVIALLIMTAVGAVAARQIGGQTWEYATLVFSSTKKGVTITASDEIVSTLNQCTTETPCKADSIGYIDALNKMGELNWELVTLNRDVSASTLIIQGFFKRPKTS